MARTLKDDLASDMLATFLNTDEFAESVVYRPRDGQPRTIAAIVDREPPERLVTASMSARSAVMVVEVANDATLGISSSLIDLGGDKIDLAERAGGTVTARSIVRIVGHDAQSMTLEVR